MNLLDIARRSIGAARVQECGPYDINDENDINPPEADPWESIRAGLRSGRLVGWHLERSEHGDLIEVPGLQPWHADGLGVPQFRSEG